VEKGPYYLAGPLKGTLEQEAHRFEVSLKLTTAFLKQGINVFSPIIYTKKIAEALDFSSDEDRRCVMMTYLLDFLKVSKGMILITMEGWKASWGVQQELKFCQKNQIPVYKIDPNEIPSDLSRILSVPLDQNQLNALLEGS